MGKRICALTMVRNDDFYLRRWVEYYGRELGKENLYVYFDGTDQVVPEFCKGVNVELKEKVKGNVVDSDKGRIDFLNSVAKRLLQDYDFVIGTDADEFLIVDPVLGISLKDYLDKADIGDSISGLGVDVGQNTDEE